MLEHDGHEVDARADEFFAVFRRAPAAIEAAVEIQRALSGQSWPDDLAVGYALGSIAAAPP